MFDRISLNDRILGSRFDQEQVIGFQMSVPSGILCSKRWKFVRGFLRCRIPDAIGQLLDGRLLIAEAGQEQDKRRERNRAKAEAARKVAAQQAGVYWIGTEATLSKTRHANLVFLHARRQTFPTWQELEEALQVIWPWGEAACVQELVERLGERWPQAEREAAIWKRCAESAARGHLLVDLASVFLTRLTPLMCLSSDTLPILPDPLPSEVPSSIPMVPEAVEEDGDHQHARLLSTFDDSTLEGPVREHFLRNLHAVEAVLAGASIVETARETQIARSTLSRLVRRTRTHGVRACIPHGTYSRERKLHPAFQEVIRRLYLLPTKLSMTAIVEHAELKRAAKRVQEDTGTAIPLPTDSARRSIPHTCWRRLLPCSRLLLPPCGCQRPNLIQTGSILCRSCPYVHMRWRMTDEAICVASLRGLYLSSVSRDSCARLGS